MTPFKKAQILVLVVLATIVSFNANGKPMGGGMPFHTTTPGGHEIQQANLGDESCTLYLAPSQELDGIEDWYYYKYYIIGTFYNNEKDTIKKHFVVNEQNDSCFLFHSISEYHKFIVGHKLEPKIWTRWWFVNEDFDANGIHSYPVISILSDFSCLSLLIWSILVFVRTKKYKPLIFSIIMPIFYIFILKIPSNYFWSMLFLIPFLIILLLFSYTYTIAKAMRNSNFVFFGYIFLISVLIRVIFGLLTRFPQSI